MELSYTLISQYKWCPRQYEYAQVMQIPTPVPWALYWGRCFHEGIEKAFQAKYEVSLDEAVAIGESAFEQAMQKGVTPEFFRKVINFTNDVDWQDLDPEEAMQTGRHMIVAYLGEYLAKLNPIGIELLTRRTITIDGTEYAFTSHLDMVTQEVIIDHKTSSRSWSQARADGELQATCYLWNKPGDQQAFVYHVILRRADAKVIPLVTKRTQEQLDEFEFVIVPEVVRGILQGDFPITSQSWRCGFCNYRTLCKGGQ